MYGAELLLPLIVGIVAYGTGSLDLLSSITGIVMGYTIIFARGFDWFLVLLFFFVLSIAATRYKYKRKERYHVSQKKRTVENVLGNGLVAVACAVYGNIYGFFGAISTATSDTVSSELGVLSKDDPIDILTGRTVRRGANGGISVLGNVAMFASSFILSLSAIVLFNDFLLFWIALWSGIFGCIIDSIFGSWLENKGVIGNSLVNFIATVFGAGMAIWLSTIISM
ncbi:MAG: DUF92 domain-containing protein [Candidatus Diapherotrites archaeon]|nr:DUF92 domain-containing protein [Candidatus Diapherotrites archaeon]